MQGTISTTTTITGATIDFTSCGFEMSGSKVWCTTEGAKSGEIKTGPLEGTLVYLSKAAKTVAIDFKPQTGKSLGTYRCLGNNEIRGSVLLPIQSVNKPSTVFTLHGNAAAEEYENEKGEKLKATLETNFANGVFAPMTWELVSEIKTASTIEIKA